jgi:hypothetical protein
MRHGLVFIVGVVSLSLVGGLSAPAKAGAVYQSTLFNSQDGPIQGKADITLGSGVIQVVLENLVSNPTSAGQLLSAINITFAANPGSASFQSTPTGTFVNIGSGGTFTQTFNQTLSHWATDTSGTTVRLSTAGDPAATGPIQMIIGTASKGSYTPSATNVYNQANPSILSSHDPSVQGPTTFLIHAWGITSSSVISSVDLKFGTGPDYTRPGILQVAAAPEPATILMAGIGVVGLIVRARWRRK